MARVYAWYVSEADARDFNWRPESWADADAGVVRHKVSGEVRSHGQMARQGDDNYVHLTLSQSPVVLVAVDPVNKMYAWRVFKYEMPLSKIYVPVSFKAWLTERYKENDWTVQKVEN
jgi:hypothetical protein